MRIVGLDLSLTKTGVADEAGTRVIRTGAFGVDRLMELRDDIVSACLPLYDDTGMPGESLAVIEGYSMGIARQPGRAFNLGELGGVVRVALYETGIPFVDVAPASLKKYATGKGNANKGMVLEAASKRSGLDFGGDDNRADAWWLRSMALDYYGQPVVTMPALNRTALDAVPWLVLA